MTNGTPRGVSSLGAAIVLGVAVVAGAAILGSKCRTIGTGRQTISVKGLAEKSIRADRAEWSIGVRVHAATPAETLNKLRGELPALRKFLADHGLTGSTLEEGAAMLEPNFE